MVRDQRDDPDWWNSLPPPIRQRIGVPPTLTSNPSENLVTTQVPDSPRGIRLAWLRDSSVLAIVFLAVALGNMLFLLLMLAFVDGPASPVP